MSERLVVVTGASTGIGRASAELLARKGFRVLATVRKDVDADALRAASDRIEPLVLDVTDPDAGERAAAAVEAAGGKLAGLVNNAGITVAGAVEIVPLDEWRRQFEVNVFAQIAMTQALLPALRAGGGRVLNISSIGGRTVAPFVGPYAASKFALEAISDALRQECAPHGVGVVVIEPGSTATPIWEKGDASAREGIEELTDDQRRLYGERLQAMLRLTAKTAARGIPPERVAEVIERALTTRRPKTRYLVGAAAKGQALMHTVLGDRGFDRVIARMLR